MPVPPERRGDEGTLTMMLRLVRSFAVAAAVVAATLAAGSAHAQTQRAEIEAIVRDYLASHPEEVQRIVKDYIAKNPDVLQEAFAELVKRRTMANADKAAAIKANASELFESSRHVVIGNPGGDVSLVEFFDYNCGFCKRALADKLNLIAADPMLRVVLKEYPVLGQGSVEAAQVGVAVRIQAPAKYLEFHRKLMGDGGRADKARALAMAAETGLDMDRLKQDLASDEIRQTLVESAKLARALGISGTPSYVIGNGVVSGAVGVAALEDRIKAARK